MNRLLLLLALSSGAFVNAVENLLDIIDTVSSDLAGPPILEDHSADSLWQPSSNIFTVLASTANKSELDHLKDLEVLGNATSNDVKEDENDDNDGVHYVQSLSVTTAPAASDPIGATPIEATPAVPVSVPATEIAKAVPEQDLVSVEESTPTEPAQDVTAVEAAPTPVEEVSVPATTITEVAPVDNTRPITYNPGELTVYQNNMLLSQGLSSRVLAESGDLVKYSNGQDSVEACHFLPDHGATYIDGRAGNEGGYIYVSNSEDNKSGGVGSFTFDKSGNLIDYRTVLSGTKANCGGGRTPWGAYISCEEHESGRLWQVDPTGQIPPQSITLGSDGGFFENFSYDIRNLTQPSFYVTEDHAMGPLRKFVPYNPDWNNPWTILTGPGETSYLFLMPQDDKGTYGTFGWTTDAKAAMENTINFNPNCEGMDIVNNQMFFISKTRYRMFVLDLDTGAFWSESTKSGLFDGQPDQLQVILGTNNQDNLLYYTEDGGRYCGIHARAGNGEFITILESPDFVDETTGLSFSPDRMRMYFAFQRAGRIMEVWRDDGLPFDEQTLNVKFHAVSTIKA